MTYELIIKEEAVKDMIEAFQWYEDKQRGLGAKFLDEVESYYDRIIKKPEHYQKHIDQRIAVLHRFPYKIVYEVEKEYIVVYAVLHTKRGPEELAKRK